MSAAPGRWAMALCGLAAVPGASAMVLVLAEDRAPLVALGGVAGLLLLPGLRRWVAGSRRRPGRLPWVLALALMGLQVALALALGLHSLLALGLTVMLYLQGECLGEATHPAPVAVVVTASLMEVLVAVDLLASPLVALLYLMAVGLAPVALVSAPALLARPGWPRGEMMRRTGLGVLLGLVALLLALSFHEAASPEPRPAAETARPPTPPPPSPPASPPAPPGERPDTREAPRTRTPEERPPAAATGSERGSPTPRPPPGEAAGQWARELLESMGTLLRGEPERATLGEVGRGLFMGPTYRGLPYLRYPLGFYLGILSQLVLVLLVLRAFRRRRRQRLELVHRLGASTPLGRLLRALEGYGHRRQPSQTLQELVGQVVARRGLAFRPLTRVAEILNRARFGGVEITPREHAFLERFLRRVEDHSVV